MVLPSGDTKAKDVNCEKKNPYEIGMEKEHFNEFFYNRGGVSPEIFNIILPDFSKARKMELAYSIVENSKTFYASNDQTNHRLPVENTTAHRRHQKMSKTKFETQRVEA
ncbi:hypothetical protein LSTR_LSTR004766 [Laodelphax striatellus]|uniref:Uncharacterized protein n=1 Tax=Laodelphax striatellus TaxID=195883 RepID=A0A482XJP5_LAOST|nr:hypothetical protein LSTR_LSTR004766 [Laodelphax striatellus]